MLLFITTINRLIYINTSTFCLSLLNEGHPKRSPIILDLSLGRFTFIRCQFPQVVYRNRGFLSYKVGYSHHLSVWRHDWLLLVGQGLVRFEYINTNHHSLNLNNQCQYNTLGSTACVPNIVSISTYLSNNDLNVSVNKDD